MEVDWTRLQPPDLITPAHPKVASPSHHNEDVAVLRTQTTLMRLCLLELTGVAIPATICRYGGRVVEGVFTVNE